MNAGAVLFWELRSSSRTLIPNPWLRRTLFGLLGLVAVLGSAAMLLLPLPQGAGSRLSTGILAGVVVGALAFGVSAAMGSASALLRQPERARLMAVAPLPPYLALGLPIATMAATSLLPFAIFFLPFVAACFRLSPAAAGMLLLCGAATFGWALLAVGFFVLGLVRLKGREAAGRIAGAGAFMLTLLSVWAFGHLLRLSVGWGSALAFLCVSGCLIPILGRPLARGLCRALQGGDPPQVAPEPQWGSPGWGRMLRRTPVFWGFLGAVPAAILLFQGRLPLRWGVLVALLLSFQSGTLGHLFALEYECPDRWRLAPESARLRASLLGRVGGGLVLATWSLLIPLGWSHWAWLAGSSLLVMLFPLSYAIVPRFPRQCLQGAFFFAALATEALR